jgi:hypothetical protein
VSNALERRFLGFLASVPGSESLDEVLAGPEFEGERRADFLLFGRKVILEVKSLEIDTSPKIEDVLSKHRSRDDFPHFYGEVELHKVLQHLPDGEEINAKVFMRITRSIEDAVRSAEEQIQNTARLLDLPDAVGVIALLNEGIDVFSPEVVSYRVSQLISRKTSSGEFRSPIAYAWLLFEAHVAKAGPAKTTLPVIVVKGPKADSFDWFSELMAYLQMAWAQFNGRPLFKSNDASLASLDIATASSQKTPEKGEKIPLHRIRALHYKANPYLRSFSDAEVLRYGRKISQEMKAYFLVAGAKVMSSLEEKDTMMHRWADFLCEAEHRGLDLKRMRDA